MRWKFFFSLFCDVFCIAALRRGLDVQSDVINLISHACEERMRHLTEKVSLVAEHRLDIHKVIACGLSNNNFSIIIKHYYIVSILLIYYYFD